MKKNSIQEAWEAYKSSVRFDSYEISPFKKVVSNPYLPNYTRHFDAVVCTVKEADFWGLYGIGQQGKLYRNQDGVSRHLFDRPTKEQCEQVLWEMFRTKEYKLISTDKPLGRQLTAEWDDDCEGGVLFHEWEKYENQRYKKMQ